METPYEAYLVIREACSRNGELVFDRPDGVHLAPVRCAATIPALAPIFAIRALPALPDL